MHKYSEMVNTLDKFYVDFALPNAQSFMCRCVPIPCQSKYLRCFRACDGFELVKSKPVIDDSNNGSLLCECRRLSSWIFPPSSSVVISLVFFISFWYVCVCDFLVYNCGYFYSFRVCNPQNYAQVVGFSWTTFESCVRFSVENTI